MTPYAAKVFESLEHCADEMQSVQFFDLSRVSPLVEHMMREYDQTFYPAMMSSDLPAEKVCFRTKLEGEPVEIYAERVEDSFRADTVDWFRIWDKHLGASKIVAGLSIDARVAYAKEHPEAHERFSQPFTNTVWTKWRRADLVAYGQEAHTTGRRIVAFLVSLCCDLIAQQNLFQHIEQTAPRAMRKRMEREGRTVPTHRFVDFARSSTVGCNWSDGDGPKKALHFVSGHWRRSAGPKSVEIEGERKTWIDGHWRGDPEIGIVTKTYVAGSKFLSSHGKEAA